MSHFNFRTRYLPFTRGIIGLSLSLLFSTTLSACFNSGVPIEGVQEEKDFQNPDSGQVPASLPVEGSTRVIAIVLVNTETDEIIKTLNDGDVIDLSDIDAPISIVAQTDPELVGSVGFYINDSKKRTENEFPYSIAGDTDGDYRSWTPVKGTRKFKAIPFADINLVGNPGTGMEITLTIQD